MAIKVITDSTADLPPGLAKELGVTVMPLKVLFGQEVYTDGVDITNKEFYSKMAQYKGLPTTAQINPGEFIEEFQSHIQKGDQVLGIFISAKLSGTYSSAVVAKETLADERIRIIDSASATFGLGLLVVAAADFVKQGKTMEEIASWLEEAKRRVHLYGVINTLENLKKGGRLTATGAFAGTLLGIKPIITIKDGSVSLIGKARGIKKAFTWVFEDAAKNKIDFNGKTVCLAHADNPEGMEELKKTLLLKFKPLRIIEFEIGSVVRTHTGPGCVGICCL